MRPIAQPALQTLLADGADTTFNCMTVDGDTSTSDTLPAVRHGRGGKRGQPRIDEATDPRLPSVQRRPARPAARAGDPRRQGRRGLYQVRDHRGRRRRKRRGGAQRIALSFANSPLVKTAIAGEDPNWGRVVMAVGKAGEAADRDQLSIWFGAPHRRPRRRARRRVRGGDSRGLHEEPRDRDPRRMSASARAAPRCGPAT